MYLPNTAHQQGLHRAFRADSTITTGGTAQLILPVASSRASLMVMNISSYAMYLEHGPARFLFTISGGQVTGSSIVNAGFNYTTAPEIELRGGFGPYVANSSWSGIGLNDSQAPSGLAVQGDISTNVTYNRPARAHCTISGGAVNSIVIDDEGYGYINPPMAYVKNNNFDPFGCAVPSTTSGIYLAPTDGYYLINGTTCWTDQVALYCGTSAAPFVCEYMV